MKRVITIAREYGSGGRLIAQEVADALAIPYYDKKLIELAAKETGLSEAYIEENEQKRTPSFLYSLYVSSKNLPVPDQVFIAQSDIIKRLAKTGPCVIVGRCSDYVLQDDPNALHVLIHAPLEDRVLRASNEYGEGLEVARMMAARIDKSRSSYYTHFTAREWGDHKNYDLCINSNIGIEVAVRIIVEAVKAE